MQAIHWQASMVVESDGPEHREREESSANMVVAVAKVDHYDQLYHNLPTG